MKQYEYGEFIDDVSRLCEMVAPVDADAIVFVARGGATLAHFMAVRLGIRSMYAINTRSYEGKEKCTAPIIEELPSLKNASNILLVDEIVDSGETLREVKKILQQANPHIACTSVALFQRENACIKADISLHITDEWVEFFWEQNEKNTR